MAALNIDHTGQSYEGVEVKHRTKKGWLIIRTCCGNEEEVTPKRLNDMIRTPLKRCLKCIKGAPKSTAAEKAAANRSRKNQAEKKAEPTIFEQAPGYWPFLGKMGFRHQ